MLMEIPYMWKLMLVDIRMFNYTFLLSNYIIYTLMLDE